MRVLVVSSMYPTDENPIGGIFVHEQVKALRAAGIDARVVSGKPYWLSGRHPLRALYRYLRGGRKAWPGWSSYDGVPVSYFSFPAGAFSRKSVYSYFYSMALGHWLKPLRRDFDYQLVHAHTAYLDGRAGARAARAASVPYVLTEHTGPLSSVTEKWSMRRQAQYGIDAADLIVTVSSALRNDLKSQLRVRPLEKIVVIPNGVDTAFFDAKHSELGASLGCVEGLFDTLTDSELRSYLSTFVRQLSLRSGLPVTTDLLQEVHEIAAAGSDSLAVRFSEDGPARIDAVWVGHHVEVKRVDRLLHAFAIARAHDPRLRLTLIGDGALSTLHEQLARSLKIESCVRFLPSMSRAQVRDRLKHADFLVISSETETFGVVAIEALSMGLPVLATACGGPSDTIREKFLGELVGNTCEDLAIGFQRIVRRLHQFNRDEIRRYAVKYYDYAKIAEQLKVNYMHLICPPEAVDFGGDDALGRAESK